MPRPGSPMQWMEYVGDLPEAVVAGTTMVTDRQTYSSSLGAYAYVFCPNAAAPLASRFYRVNLLTGTYQRLADPLAEATSVAGTGCTMIVDASRPGRPAGGGNIDVMLFHPLSAAPWASVTTYDRVNNNWIHLDTVAQDFNNAALGVAALGAQWGTDAAGLHQCTTVHASGVDTNYWFGGNNSIYTYVIDRAAGTVNRLADGGAVRAAMGVGGTLDWFPEVAIEPVWSFRGGASGAIDSWVAAGAGTWTAGAVAPAGETFTAGTAVVHLPVANLNALPTGWPLAIVYSDGRLFYYNPTNGQIAPIGNVHPVSGAPVVGQRLCIAQVGEESYLYAPKPGTRELWRTRLIP